MTNRPHPGPSAKRPAAIDVALALTDSPAGQLAWNSELFMGWGGENVDNVERDWFLTRVSIFWFTATAGSAAPMYLTTCKHRGPPVRVSRMSTRASWAVRCQDGRSTDALVGATVSEADAEYDLVFSTEFPAVMRAVYLVVHDVDRAEDITQDAFVRLLRHWKKVSRYDRPGAWVRRVAINLAISSARREGRRRIIERPTAPPPEQPVGDADVLRAIRSLSPMQRAAVVLFYLEDRPVSEVAHVLGCAQSTARVHLHRARRRLAEILGEEVPQDAP